VDDTLDPDTGQCFSNNWFLFMKMEMWHCIHVCSEPSERREEILDMLEDKGFKIENIVLYSAEEDGFLGRNGSLP
jgi:hypothetical protein